MITTIWLVSLTTLSVFSCFFSYFALARSEKRRTIALERAVADCRFEVQELANSYDSVRKTVKRINSRYAMRERRAKDAETPGDDDTPNPETHPEEWRAHMMRKHPRGVFS